VTTLEKYLCDTTYPQFIHSALLQQMSKTESQAHM